jgi:hypothetical protein
MAKEYYNVTYKTYFNDRIYPVIFQGQETYPLYVQVTYDRKTIFFKSYYFNMYVLPKYEFLGISLAQVEKLESRLIESIIISNSDSFSLDDFSRKYKLLGSDLLEGFERPFKIWLSNFFKSEGSPGLAAVIVHDLDEVAAIQLWDDLKRNLQPDIFDRMREKAVRYGPPYFALAAYVRHASPKGPFCLPRHEWSIEAKRIEIREFLENTFEGVDFEEVIRAVNVLFRFQDDTIHYR